jgi:hypothetical protein
MHTLKIYFPLLAGCFTLLILFASCVKPVDINLPPDENRLVVEGYLTPNKRLAVALQISTGITSTLPLQLVSRAFVTISHAGVTDTLHNIPFIDTANGRAYNYSSPKLMVEDYINTYNLFIYDSTSGNSYTSSAKLLQPVPIDSIDYTSLVSNL